MNKGYFHSSGTLPIEMYPDRFHVQDFVFTVGEEETPWVITSFTWAFVLKKNKGNNTDLLFLTLGNGLSFPIYETNRLRARFEAATLKAIGEGEYFWMLIKTDTNEPILKGECKLTFDPASPNTVDSDVTVNIVNNTVQVLVQALLTGNSSGGGGGSGGSDFYRGDFTMTTAYPADGTGSGPAGAIQSGDQWRLIIGGSGEVTIGGVQYLDGQLIEAAIDTPGQTTANWIRIVT